MILRNDNGMLPAALSLTERSLVLGALLAVYPLGQFLGSPVLGALSDRYGRRPILIGSLAATTALYAGIAAALEVKKLLLLMLVSFLTGLSEANVVIAQGAIADGAPRSERSRLDTSTSAPASHMSLGLWAAASWRTIRSWAGSLTRPRTGPSPCCCLQS